MKEWILNNYQWLIGVAIAIIGLVFSYFIARYQIRKNKKDNHFNSKFEFYKNIRNYFDDIENNDFSGMYQLQLLLEDSENPFFDKVELLKGKYLFNKNTYDKIVDLSEKCYAIARVKGYMNDFYNYMTTSNDIHPSVNKDFKDAVKVLEKNSNEKEKESLKRFFAFYSKNNFKLGINEQRDYDYYEMFEEKKAVIKEFKSEFKVLIKSMEKQLNF